MTEYDAARNADDSQSYSEMRKMMAFRIRDDAGVDDEPDDAAHLALSKGRQHRPVDLDDDEQREPGVDEPTTAVESAIAPLRTARMIRNARSATPTVNDSANTEAAASSARRMNRSVSSHDWLRRSRYRQRPVVPAAAGLEVVHLFPLAGEATVGRGDVRLSTRVTVRR